MLVRRLLGLLLPLVLLAPLTACSGSASAQEVVSRATSATVDASTAAVRLTVAMPGATTLGPRNLSGHGAVDFTHRRSAMTFEAGDASSDVGMAVETRTDHRDLYFRSPLLSGPGAGQPAGQWLKVDLASAAEEGGLDPSQLQAPGTIDPAQALALLEGVTQGGVQRLSAATIDGVRTTRYRARIDVSEAVQRSGAVTEPKTFAKLARRLGVDTITVDVWIDGDGLLRRLQVPIPVPVTKGAADGNAVVTVDLTDIGSPVDVDPPVSSTPVDLGNLRSLLGPR